MDTSTLHNEKELLAKVARGDEAAFTKLFYAYHNKLGRFIIQLTGSHEMAEEIVQDIFMKIWTKRQTLITIERFDAYLYILSRNHTFNCLRQLAKDHLKKEKVIERLNKSGIAQEEVVSSEYYMLIDQAVEKLPPQQQKAYILSRRECLKYEEIAQQMNLSKETVKKYLKLATRSIKNYVSTYGNVSGGISE